METDPSARGQPESYTARYKTFACSQIDAAIAKYDSLSSEIGKHVVAEAERHTCSRFSSPASMHVWEFYLANAVIL